MSKVEPMKSDDLDWWVDFVPDAAIVVGQDQVVLAANGRANALFGAQECGLKGKSLELLIPEALRRSHRRHVKNFFSKDQCRAMGSGLRLQGRRLDGRLLPVDIMLNQFCIGDKHISMAVIRDDSDRVAICRMKDELEASNARLSRAQAVGGLGWWELDHESDQLTWSSMVPVILGLPVEAEPSFELIATLCLDEDGPHLLVKDRAGKDIVGKRLTYKIVRPDGGIRWVEETVDSVSDGRVSLCVNLNPYTGSMS